jgi:hypothetical protein
VVLQGLPEMPIRGIHLRNVSLTAEAGMVWMDAENITLDHVEIVNHQGPVLTVFDTRNSVIDHLTYSAGAEAVIKLTGDANSNIVFTSTDLKAAAKEIIGPDGASATLQVK